MEPTLSKRGKELIIYQNYKFSCKEYAKNPVNSGEWKKVTTLRCWYIDEGKITFLNEEIKHDYLLPENLDQQIFVISNHVNRAEINDLIEKPLKIISKELF